MNRRKFIRQASLAAMALGIGLPEGFATSNTSSRKLRLTILHTNDQHSRIDPFPMDSGKLAGLGGAARRAALIKQIRATEEHVLLLDAGDIFQGTPYFNYYGGELEFKLMSEMGYDAATLGNHDFDAGIDGLLKQWPHARFDFINCNYDFSQSALAGKVLPYKIFKYDGFKVGVTGVGIDLEGLVPPKLFEGVQYTDPVQAANQQADWLKDKAGCDYVILLSHLGYKYETDKISDLRLAPQTKSIDLIIGGHTHTFLDKPTELLNQNNEKILVTQAGWAGVLLGRIELEFDRTKGRKSHRDLSSTIQG